MNTTQNYFLYFSALKQTNGLQDLSRYPHEESSQKHQPCAGRETGKVLKIMNCIPLPGADETHNTKTIKMFSNFFFFKFAERAGASQKKRNTCFCKAQLFLLCTTGNAANSCLPKQNCSTSQMSTCTPVLLIFSNHPDL